MDKPAVIYYCNKCGYFGPTSAHVGCNYFACTSLTQQWADQLEAENARLREENKAFESDVETIAAHNIELQEQLAAAQAVIEQMRKALQGLVKNDGVDAFYHLDKGIGTATVSGKCWLRAREAATLQPCPEVLNKVRVEAVAKFAKHVDDYEVDKLAAVYIKHIEKGEA